MSSNSLSTFGTLKQLSEHLQSLSSNTSITTYSTSGNSNNGINLINNTNGDIQVSNGSLLGSFSYHVVLDNNDIKKYNNGNTGTTIISKEGYIVLTGLAFVDGNITFSGNQNILLNEQFAQIQFSQPIAYSFLSDNNFSNILTSVSDVTIAPISPQLAELEPVYGNETIISYLLDGIANTSQFNVLGAFGVNLITPSVTKNSDGTISYTTFDLYWTQFISNLNEQYYYYSNNNTSAQNLKGTYDMSFASDRSLNNFSLKIIPVTFTFIK